MFSTFGKNEMTPLDGFGGFLYISTFHCSKTKEFLSHCKCILNSFAFVFLVFWNMLKDLLKRIYDIDRKHFLLKRIEK